MLHELPQLPYHMANDQLAQSCLIIYQATHTLLEYVHCTIVATAL